MRVLKKIILFILILALLYGALLFVEKLTSQELTRVTNPATEEAVCLMWKPQLLKGNGVCFLDLLNAQGKRIDTVELGTLDVAFNALQEFGQLRFQDQDITVASRENSNISQRFIIQDNRLILVD